MPSAFRKLSWKNPRISSAQRETPSVFAKGQGVPNPIERRSLMEKFKPAEKKSDIYDIGDGLILLNIQTKPRKVSSTGLIPISEWRESGSVLWEW